MEQPSVTALLRGIEELMATPDSAKEVLVRLTSLEVKLELLSNQIRIFLRLFGGTKLISNNRRVNSGRPKGGVGVLGVRSGLSGTALAYPQDNLISLPTSTLTAALRASSSQPNRSSSSENTRSTEMVMCVWSRSRTPHQLGWAHG